MMKKRVAIITFCNTLDNYGQILQAFALQRYLRDNYDNLDVRLIHEFPSTQSAIEKKVFSFSHLKTIKRYFSAYILCLDKYHKKLQRDKMKILKKALEETLEEHNMNFYKNKIDSLDKKRSFLSFKQKYIALSSFSCKEFSAFSKEYDADCYIVGSDQVWNDFGGEIQNNCTQRMDFFTLEFLPQNHQSKKISYAASLGKAEIKNYEEAYFKKALAKFDCISVRESRNIKTLANIGLNAQCVPDPTQLLRKSDYEKLIYSALEEHNFHTTKSDGKVRKDSIFVYMLGNETHINKDNLMGFLESQHSVIYTNANVDFSCQWDIKSDFAPSIEEFLACIRDCKLVITNSFHCCVLSIIFNTPFVALKLGPSEVANGMNERFYNLFSLFDLQYLLVDNINDLKTQMSAKFHWETINAKMAQWRNVGIEFLDKNLKVL